MVNRKSLSKIRSYRATSWIKRAQDLDHSDIDGRFIFYWIAFNALYGQPKYLERRKNWGGTGKRPPSEEEDIHHFLNGILPLGNIQPIAKALDSTKEDWEKLLKDKFLSDQCWVYWNEKNLLTAEDREKEGNLDAFKGTQLNQVFHRLYVLRKQLFHGCSTDGGSKNRKMLKQAVVVLEKLVPLLRDLVQEHGEELPLLKRLPYPPSL